MTDGLQNRDAMRVLFNATNLRSEGGVVLLQHLLEGFLSYQESLQLWLYLNPELMPRLPEALTQHPRLQVVSFRPNGSLKRFVWEQLELPKRIRSHAIDTLFSFGNTGPRFPGCRQILYVQQSIPYSSYQPTQNRWQWHYFKWLYGMLIGLAQQGSERIIVPTRWLLAPMRKSIRHQKPINAYRVTLPGIPKLDTPPAGTLYASHEQTLLTQLEQWRASDERILLYPCYLAPYKNIPFLLQAIEHLAQRLDAPRFRLILTFKADSREYFPCKLEIMTALQQLKTIQPEQVVLAGTLNRTAMAAVYRMSDVLTFPSLVETLGLPLLEAMSHGIPIVALQSPNSNASEAAFAQEICQEAALYAPPNQPEAFAEQLYQALTNDALWQQLSQAGRARAQALSWEAHVQRILGQ